MLRDFRISELRTLLYSVKALIGEGILWLMQVCQVAWKFGKTPRDWLTGGIILIFKKGHRSNAQTTEGYHSIVCQGKYMPNYLKGNALKGNAEKLLNQNWKMAVWFLSASQHHRPNLHSEANLR